MTAAAPPPHTTRSCAVAGCQHPGKAPGGLCPAHWRQLPTRLHRRLGERGLPRKTIDALVARAVAQLGLE